MLKYEIYTFNYVTFYIDVLKEYEEELNNILELIDLEVN